MTPSDELRLKRLCSLFSIPVNSTTDNPPAAYAIVSMLYTMPAISEHDQRRRFGNDILQNVNAQFPPSDGPGAAQFFSAVQARVIEMQEFPGWYAELSRTPEELVRIYTRMQYGVKALNLIGISAGTGAVAAGIKEAIKKPGSVDFKAFRRTTVGRSMGKGAIFEGIEARYGDAAKGGGVALALIVAAAWATFLSLSEEMRKIKIILMDKFQSGQLSDELYRVVFKEIDPSEIKKYWELDK
jgi:hypothetical protein